MERFKGETLKEYLSNKDFLTSIGGNHKWFGGNKFINKNDELTKAYDEQDKAIAQLDAVKRTHPTDNISKFNSDLVKPLEEAVPAVDTIKPTNIVTKDKIESINKYIAGDVKPKPSNTAQDDFFYRLGKVESDNNYKAHRKNSAFYGKYQFGKERANEFLSKIGKTWEDYKNNGAIQEKLARMHIDDYKRRYTRVGIKPTQLNLWMAHNLGFKGALNVLGDKVTKKGLANIRNQAGMNSNSTVQDYVNRYGKIFQ